MKTFREMIESINTADQKPETYTGPDGKPRTRMVPVHRDIVKETLYDVSWGIGIEAQVSAKDSSEAIKKAKDVILKKKPKLSDKKYSDTWEKRPAVHRIR